MISKTYGELVLINSDYDMGLQIPREHNTPLQPRLFQWVSWFKCGAMTDTLAQAVARLFNWQRCGLSLTTGAEFCFRVKGNTDPKTPVQPVSNRRDYGIFTSSGLCFLSQSLSAAFMRVCQPSPVALNALITSGEQRKVTRILGLIAFGLPSLTSFSPSYKAAPEKNASSSSGASSGSFQVFFKSCFFAFIGFPHGDNTPCVIAWRPDQNHNAPIECSGCYIPDFAVILPYILSRKVLSGEHLTSTRKVKAALVKRPVSFVIVVVNFHTIIVCTKNKFVNYLPLRATSCYRYPAPHKTGVGRGNPKLLQATPDAASVFFVVRYTRHSMAWCVIRQRSYNRRYVALLAYHAAHNGTICGCCVRLRPAIDAQNRISRRPIMVTLAGLPKGRPVPCNAGISTPVNVTALFERGNSSGDSLNLLQEAVCHG